MSARQEMSANRSGVWSADVLDRKSTLHLTFAQQLSLSCERPWSNMLRLTPRRGYMSIRTYVMGTDHNFRVYLIVQGPCSMCTTNSSIYGHIFYPAYTCFIRPSRCARKFSLKVLPFTTGTIADCYCIPWVLHYVCCSPYVLGSSLGVRPFLASECLHFLYLGYVPLSRCIFAENITPLLQAGLLRHHP